jgi:hypothetical protein
LRAEAEARLVRAADGEQRQYAESDAGEPLLRPVRS